MPSIVPINIKEIRNIVKKGKITKASAEMILRNVICYPELDILGDVGLKYKITTIEGVYGIYHKNYKDKTLEEIEDTDLYKEVNRIVEKLGKAVDEGFLMNHAALSGFVKKLTLTCETIGKDDFACFGFLSDKKWLLARADFDPIEGTTRQDLKHWWEFLERLSNADAFMAFIGSLFDAKSRHEQYVWIHSSGGDGKSKVMDALKTLFKTAMRSVESPENDKPDKFWMAKFYNAKLVVMREADNCKFINSGTFKSLVTREPVSVEKKYRDAKELILQARFIIVGNSKPDPDLYEGAMRRLIYCQLTKPVTPTGDFVDKLVLEIPAFISACLATYKKLYNGLKIETKQDVMTNLLQEKRGEDLDMFNALFRYDEGHYLESGDVMRALFSEFRISKNRYIDVIKSWILLLDLERWRGTIEGKNVRIIKHINWRYGDRYEKRSVTAEGEMTDECPNNGRQKDSEKINDFI